MSSISCISICILFYFIHVAHAFTETLLEHVYPVPVLVGTNPAFSSAAAELQPLFESALREGADIGDRVTPNTTSISIRLSSIHSNDSLFDFSYTSSLLNGSTGGTASVDQTSIFRIGSISKLFTVYALLLNGGFDIWDDPITKFVPELKSGAEGSAISGVQWEDVTLGSLCSHLSGIGRDYTSADISSAPFPWVEMGLPPLSDSELPQCGSGADQSPCSRAAFLKGFKERRRVTSPYSTPVYSNAAFALVHYALESITGRDFESIMTRDVFEPLGLSRTSTKLPNDITDGVIHPGKSEWSSDLGDQDASGGMYSSVEDLIALGHAILTHRQLDSLTTRKWMKPQAHTGSMHYSVGAPWEIFRTTVSGRTVDLYSKGGDIGAYHSLFTLIPEYGIVLTVLLAGPFTSVVEGFHYMILEKYILLIEEAAKSQTCETFCGIFRSEPLLNSSLIVTQDSEPGLIISRWISNGTDMLSTAEMYATANGALGLKSIRLYHLDSASSNSEEGSKLETKTFRAVFYTTPSMGRTWSSIDGVVYGGVAVDEFVFVLDATGQVVQVDVAGLRCTLYRVLEGWCETNVLLEGLGVCGRDEWTGS